MVQNTIQNQRDLLSAQCTNQIRNLRILYCAMDSCYVFLPISEPGCCAYHEVCRSQNGLVHLAALRIPLMNPPYVGILKQMSYIHGNYQYLEVASTKNNY